MVSPMRFRGAKYPTRVSPTQGRSGRFRYDWPPMLLDVFSDNPFATNCWIAGQDDAEEVVVIDPGFEAAAIRDKVARTGRRLAAVLATHGHGDHIGAVKEVCGEEVPLYIHEADELALTDQATWGAGYAAQADFRPVEVRTVRDSDVLEFAGFRIEVVHTAHEIARLYGYRYVETPAFERTEVFERTSGGSSDVVTKEMSAFEDKGGRSLTLKPEST